MRAIVIYEEGGPERLLIEERPIPEPEAGKTLIQVRAFGLNRSEMFTRWGHSRHVVTFPRVLGIELVGEVVACPSGRYAPGQQVAAIMGGLGRKFDGGYQEYALVPDTIVIPFQSALPWSVLGAVPEMYQTASGSLVSSLNLQPGETLLIRGGTSSVGLMAAQLAKLGGSRVLSTTRSLAKADALRAVGVDEVILDTGEIAPAVRALHPDGVDKVLELVGPTVLMDSLRCVRRRGIVCQTGYLGNQWAFDRFSPLGDIPSSVYLTAYSGGTEDLPPAMLQTFLDNVAAGSIHLQIDRVFSFDEIVAAHAYMEGNQAAGKLVVVV